MIGTVKIDGDIMSPTTDPDDRDANRVAVVSGLATFGDRIHRDPADRIIVATARVNGAKLLSSDGPIVESGLVEVIA